MCTLNKMKEMLVFMRILTKRFIINSLNNINVSKSIRYERYYINDRLRAQKG